MKRALVTLWTTANRICSKRLVPFLPELIEVMERHGHLSLPADVRGKLLTISPATADRLLATERSNQRGMSTTRPGSLLKKQIKVRTFADWDDLQPGFLEADLVAHCGVSAAGSFLHTLVLVDVATGWTECVALLRRSEADVIGALNSLRGRLPVPLLGLDTDNGSEFINYEMLRYCQREQITFTRSRVNRKNDQAFVEEKNGSVVRRLIGYDRYEGLGAWRALIHLYEILRLYVNFFQPSMKLIEKQREGVRVKKRYDRAQTPYQRIIASGYLTKRKRERIESLYRKLDPVTLLKELEQRQDHFGPLLMDKGNWRGTTPPERWMLSSGSISSRSPLHKNLTRSEDIDGRKSPGLGGPERIPSLKSGQRFVSSWKSIPLKPPKRFSLGFSNAILVDFSMGNCGRCSDE